MHDIQNTLVGMQLLIKKKEEKRKRRGTAIERVKTKKIKTNSQFSSRRRADRITQLYTALYELT